MSLREFEPMANTKFRWISVCVASAITCAAGLAANAQVVADAGAVMNAGAQTAIFAELNVKPIDLATRAGAGYSSSGVSSVSSLTTSGEVDEVSAERLNLAGVNSEALQPPPRRRYGRPRYNDKMHNADGSSKYEFLAGVGGTAPLGNTRHYLNTNYAFQVGAGRNFNKTFSLLAQFDYDRFGFNGKTLFDQENAEFGGQSYPLDGKSHIWSFTLNPVVNIYKSEGLGAYVVGGVGLYHKVADFTVQVTAQCYYYGYPYQCNANQTIDHYTSNAPGFNGGFGLTYKPSRFSSQRLYGEVRYVFIDNQHRAGVTTATASSYAGYNLYPANSNRTTYVPFKVGIRF